MLIRDVFTAGHVVVLILAGLFLSLFDYDSTLGQGQSQNQSLLTYKNPNLGSIQYPSDWEVQEEPSPECPDAGPELCGKDTTPVEEEPPDSDTDTGGDGIEDGSNGEGNGDNGNSNGDNNGDSSGGGSLFE